MTIPNAIIPESGMSQKSNVSIVVEFHIIDFILPEKIL